MSASDDHPVGPPGAWLDLPFLVLVLMGGIYAFWRYHAAMDVYEKAMLVVAVPALVALGRFWSSLRVLGLAVGAASLLAIALYSRIGDGFGADLSQTDHVFLLKYFLASQSAILWMGVLIFMSTTFYWLGFLGKVDGNPAQRIGSRLAWVAVFMALVGTFVRWFESHQMAPDVGHIPVSNLYEVFVLFCWLTTLLSLYHEQHAAARSLSAFVMLIVSAAAGFLLWYAVERGANEIQPLVPALQSWWMKLHVPANFIGYGSFALSAMVAFAFLVKRHSETVSWRKLMPLFLLGTVLCLEPVVFRKDPIEAIGSFWAVYLGVAVIVVGGILWARRRIGARLPTLEVLDDVIARSIAVGFAFFTIATILGAFWAAEAWGGYWSWDPKETWALIVWFNYAAWLHMRLINGMRGGVSAWWALVGLVVTTFAFLGVNVLLSGLHSYGEL
ncbi:c-type cytochrome biogenesis protein CcsB [Hydrogenophaga sp.]|uniref:c-type cytochrome biogenesis protein CcsB n=1 Tax=Hydrogenophaga sp. TaxID=1904254 RepID=UPI003F6FC00D